MTAADRLARFGHAPAAVFVGERESLALSLERRLFDRGSAVAVIRQWNPSVEEAIDSAGILAIVINKEKPSLALPTDDDEAAEMVMRWLEARRTMTAEPAWTDGEGI